MIGDPFWFELPPHSRNSRHRNDRLPSPPSTALPMVRAREPKPLQRWSILILRAKAVWLGDVEAATEAEAIAKGAEAFGQDAKR